MTITWADWPVETVRLDALVLRKDIQPRGAPGRGALQGGSRGRGSAKGKFVPSAVNRYANRLRAGEIPPPVSIGRYRGKLLLIDGFQRVEASRLVGFQEIPGRIAPVNDLKQVRWEAILANRDHGVPLATKVRKYAFKTYMAAEQYRKPDGTLKSYQEITLDLGGLMSKTSVYRYLHELYPAVAEALSFEHGAMTGVPQRDGSFQLPPVLSVHEDLIQGVRDAFRTAIDEAPGDPDFRESLALVLRDLLAELALEAA